MLCGMFMVLSNGEAAVPENALAILGEHLTAEAKQRLGAEPAALDPKGHELARIFLQDLAAPGQVFPDGAAAGKTTPAQVAALMAHRVSLLGGYEPQELGDPIDWFRAPKDDLQWPTHLSRHYWLRPLAQAWRGEGNEAAAGQVVAILLDWVAKTPIGTDTLHWSGVRTAYPDRYPGCPEGFFKGYVDGPWTSLSAHARLEFWSELFALLWDAPQMTNEAVAVLLVSLARDHRLSMLNNPRAMNQYQGIAVSLIHLGWWYPFLAGAEEAGAIGWERLVHYARTEVYPDGSMAECSPNYAAGCLQRLFKVVQEARARGADVPPVMLERIAQAQRAFAFLADPAGNSPRIAKGGGSILGLLAALNAEFADPEVAYVATRGKAGQRPEALSHAFPWAGHIAARSDWTAEADWLFFEPGPRGSGHHDLAWLNLQVQARGAWLLTDPGYFSYSSSGEDGAMSLYLRSSAAHNVALVDGQGQNRVRPGGRSGPNTEPGEYGWSDDGQRFRAEGVYANGFGPDGAIAVVHRRVVVYDRSRRAIEIEDHFTGEGTHEMSLHWQFPPAAEVGIEDAALRVVNGAARARMAFAAHGPLEIEVVKERRDPLGGWFSATYGKLAPAPMGVVRTRVALPSTIRTTIQLD